LFNVLQDLTLDR